MVRKVIDQGENECACGVIYVEVVIVLVFVSMWKVGGYWLLVVVMVVGGLERRSLF